jgi:hypothetical protein
MIPSSYWIEFNAPILIAAWIYKLPIFIEGVIIPMVFFLADCVANP